jgi:hypothetical protein
MYKKKQEIQPKKKRKGIVKTDPEVTYVTE